MPSIKARIREIDAELPEFYRQGCPEREWDDAAIGRLWTAINEPDDEGEVPLDEPQSDPVLLDALIKLSLANDHIHALDLRIRNLKGWVAVLALIAAALFVAVVIAIGAAR